MGKIPKPGSLALIGGGSTTYASGRKLFLVAATNGYKNAADKAANAETEGLLCFAECFDNGKPIGKEHLLYWSSLHKEIEDRAQSAFGQALALKFNRAMSVAEAETAMQEVLIGVGAGTPQSHIWLTLEVSRVSVPDGVNPDGTPRTIYKKMVKVVKAEYCTPATAPTAPTTNAQSQAISATTTLRLFFLARFGCLRRWQSQQYVQPFSLTVGPVACRVQTSTTITNHLKIYKQWVKLLKTSSMPIIP